MMKIVKKIALAILVSYIFSGCIEFYNSEESNSTKTVVVDAFKKTGIFQGHHHRDE